MIDIQAGDILFDEFGDPCQVTFVSPIMLGNKCYEVVFSDRTRIVADAEHLWQTETHSIRKANRRHVINVRYPNKVRRHNFRNIFTTEEIKGTLMHGVSLNHSVPVSNPIRCSERELPINPYVLGVWLGDGNADSSLITICDTQIVQEIEKVYSITPTKRYGDKAPNFRVGEKPPLRDRVTGRMLPNGSLTSILNENKLLKNKHIPQEYLRSSYQQRLSLLQGLMDTDGYANTNGSCEFTSCSKLLANDVYELICSLGIRCGFSTGMASIGGKIYGEKYRLLFTPYIPVFRLTRKLERQTKSKNTRKVDQRYIVEVNPTPSVPVKCIQVDSLSSLYLATRSFIPTHNTWGGTVKSLIMSIEYPGIRIWVTAPVFKTLTDATMPKYQEIFGGIPGYAKFLGGDNPAARLSNGGEILFRSTDKPDNLRGGEIGAFHMDEAAQSTYYAFQILQGRLRQRQPNGEFYPLQGWLSTTPKGLNWLYHEFVVQERSNYEYFSWTTSDNYFLPPEYIDGMDYTGKFRLQELEGKFLNLEGECLFNVANLDRRQQADCHDPIRSEHNGLVKMWKEPLVGVRYVAGVDCADEGGGGVNCMVVLNQQTLEECCRIHGDISSDDFSRFCDEWGRKYNNALLGVEANGIGSAVIANLKNMGYPKLYKRDTDKLGWYTSGANRTPMLEAYRIAIDRNQITIYSSEAINEHRTFVRKADGSWEHMDKRCFDDHVLAGAIALRMCQERQGFGVILSSIKRLVTTC